MRGGQSQEGDSSISEMLELLRLYRNNDKQAVEERSKDKDKSQLSFDSKLNFIQQEVAISSRVLSQRTQNNPIPQGVFKREDFPVSKVNEKPKRSNNQETSVSTFKTSTDRYKTNLDVFESSIYKVKKIPQSQFSSKSKRTMPNSLKRTNNSIFEKLYKENREMSRRRQLLVEEGKRASLLRDTKQCTFYPNSTIPHRLCTQSEGEQFYSRNIEWLSRVQQFVRQRQVELNTSNIKQLTFSPSINKRSESRSKSKSKESVKGVKEVKGVNSYLQRLERRRQAEDLLRDRREAFNKTALFSSNKNFIF